MSEFAMSLAEICPLMGLSLHTKNLVLAPATEDEALSLSVAVAHYGVHDPSVMPFVTPWTDQAPEMVARSVFRNVTERSQKRLHLAARISQRVTLPIGLMSLTLDDDGESFTTGSYLLSPFQGKGFGTQMRVAALDLAFHGLQRNTAYTAAFTNNSPSLSVARKLGYEHYDTVIKMNRGEPLESLKFVLRRENWTAEPSTRMCGLDELNTWLSGDLP